MIGALRQQAIAINWQSFRIIFGFVHVIFGATACCDNVRVTRETDIRLPVQYSTATSGKGLGIMDKGGRDWGLGLFLTGPISLDEDIGP